jgi:hypothetical protein
MIRSVLLGRVLLRFDWMRRELLRLNMFGLSLRVALAERSPERMRLLRWDLTCKDRL